MFALVQHAWRSWTSAKSVAALSVIALAAGVGSATAIYTVVDTVLMKPVPWQRGDRFVSLFGSTLNAPSKSSWSSNSWLDLLEYQRRTRSFDAFGIYMTRDFVLTSPGEPRHLQGVEVTPSFVSSLGVAPMMGRWFDEGNADVAAISYALWKRLGAGPAIVGQTLKMDGRQYTVTGVMPEWFRLPIGYVEGGEYRADVWVPLNPQGVQRTRDSSLYFCYARLRPGVTLAQADQDVKRVAAEIAAEHPNEHRQYTALVVSLVDSVVKEIRPSLLLLFGAAGALLLITCANVAGLLLARSVARARETAIRLALGATGRQLALQYFVEGLLVALAGAALGVGLSVLLVRLVLSMAAGELPRADGVALNGTTLLFALGAAILSSLVFSLAPLWQAIRILPNEALGDGVRASAPARTRRLSRSLVVSEVALAFTLLSVGALLIGHLNRLLHTSPGFDPDGLLTFSLNTSRTEYPGPERLFPYQTRLLEAVRHIPGVSAAALVNNLPLGGCCYETKLFPEGTAPREGAVPAVNLVIVSSGYFQTMRIPVLEGRELEGRDLETRDAKEDLLGIVIDSAAAKRYWPGRDALGAYARLGGANTTRVRIVGIVGDVRNRGLNEETEPQVYLPAAVLRMDPMQFMVRSRLPAATLIPEVRRAIRGVDPSQPLYDERTMNEIILLSLTTERLQSLLTGFFAVAALLMAALGVYGVVSYSVRGRTVEIGTRMALGALGRDVLRLVMGDGVAMAAYGIAIGGIAVMAAAFLLKSQIFAIRVDDPRPFLYAAAVVAGCSALSCLVPGWRAALVSPMVAIRDDPGSITRGLVTRLAALVSSPAQEAEVSESALMAEFVDSSRGAESFQEAIQAVLTALCEAVGCESALLFDKVSLGKDGAQAYRVRASAPAHLQDGCTIPANGLLTGRLRGYPFPLPLTEGDLEAWSRWCAAQKPEHGPEIESLRKMAPLLAVPLLAKNDLVGILLLGGASYSASKKRALRNCAGQFALLLENARLTERVVAQEKLNRDVQLATEVQKRLFPDKPPTTTAVALAGISLPARSVGGDYYDFLDLGGQRIGIALADVAGKGVPAALIMSVVQASLRVLAAEQNGSLAALAAKLNRFLHRSTGSNAYATFFYGEIDEAKRQLRYVNAGHNPPCLLRCSADCSIEELPAGGTVIGLFPHSSYEESVVNLNPGDVLLAFTDGVPEALNPKEEEFGEERLKDLLRQVSGLEVSEIVSRIAGELKSWIHDAEQFDDLTFIVMKVKPAPPHAPPVILRT